MRTFIFCLLISLTSFANQGMGQCSDCGTGFVNQTGAVAPIEYQMGAPITQQLPAVSPMGYSSGQYQSVSPAVQRLRVLSDGRPFLKALVDDQWTRSISVYGGTEDFNANGGDVFDGQVDLDNDEVYGLEIGRRHSSYLRSTFDFTYRSSNLTAPVGVAAGELEVFSLMKNLYFDLKPGRMLSPYAGFGFGWAYLDGESNIFGTASKISGESTFAYQAYGGLNLKLKPRLAFYTEYRFFSTSDVELEGTGVLLNEGNYSAHNVFFGLRYGF